MESFAPTLYHTRSFAPTSTLPDQLSIRGHRLSKSQKSSTSKPQELPMGGNFNFCYHRDKINYHAANQDSAQQCANKPSFRHQTHTEYKFVQQGGRFAHPSSRGEEKHPLPVRRRGNRRLLVLDPPSRTAARMLGQFRRAPYAGGWRGTRCETSPLSPPLRDY
jgi:hypothetical protein